MYIWMIIIIKINIYIYIYKYKPVHEKVKLNNTAVTLLIIPQYAKLKKYTIKKNYIANLS